MAYAVLFDYVGVPGINYGYAPDTVQRTALGTRVQAQDPFWNGAQFIYLKSNDVILLGSLVTWDLANVATLVPNTANLGVSVAVAYQAAAANTFFWAATQADLMPVQATASVAAGTTFGLTAAGKIGANTAGKQILNAKSVIASAGTVAKSNAQTTNGSPILLVQDSSGWYPGITLSGTGISGTVTAISPDGRTVTMSAAATATGSITATGTHTGFNLAQFSQPFVQGAIT